MVFLVFLVLFWVVLASIGLAFYLVPSIVAFKISHPYRWLILFINVFCGWTVLGWFVLLILIILSCAELERRKREGTFKFQVQQIS
jgi:hypothetical protein